MGDEPWRSGLDSEGRRWEALKRLDDLTYPRLPLPRPLAVNIFGFSCVLLYHQLFEQHVIWKASFCLVFSFLFNAVGRLLFN